jgi:hypothetical protein
MSCYPFLPSLLVFPIYTFVLIFLLSSPTDLKPENLLFRTQAEDADIMIADFGLSRIMEEEKLNMLTEICGTPGVSREFYFHLFKGCSSDYSLSS